AARLTQAAAKIHVGRIESVAKQIGRVDVVTARALAPLPRLLELAEPFLAAGARGLFPKGQDVDNELTVAAKSWKIQSTTAPNRTDQGVKLLIVEQIQPTPAAVPCPTSAPAFSPSPTKRAASARPPPPLTSAPPSLPSRSAS